MHVAWLAGATKLLAEAKDSWRGTLMAVFQPAEETGEGAQAMINDGPFKGLPSRTDLGTARHGGASGHGRRARRRDHLGGGQSADTSIWTRSARFDAASQHRSRRHGRLDRSQASDHRILGSGRRGGGRALGGCPSAGTKENVIPDEAIIKLNVRTFDAGVRTRVLAAIEGIANAEQHPWECPGRRRSRPPISIL